MYIATLNNIEIKISNTMYVFHFLLQPNHTEIA